MLIEAGPPALLIPNWIFPAVVMEKVGWVLLKVIGETARGVRGRKEGKVELRENGCRRGSRASENRTWHRLSGYRGP